MNADLPITEIAFFKHADFQLWVTDPEGHPAAVAPVSPRGSGDGRVHVLYATPGSAQGDKCSACSPSRNTSAFFRQARTALAMRAESSRF